MTTVDQVTVEQFGSDLLRTRIERGSAGYRWTRQLGRAAPFVFSTSSPYPRVIGVTFADDDSRHDTRSYTVAGRSSVADRLLAGDLADPDAAARLITSVEQFASALRALHDRLAPAHPSMRRHRGWLRLHRWTTGRAGTSVALHAVDNVRTELGELRWATLARWAEGATDIETPAVMLHGAPGLGSIVVDDTCSGPELLTGEDMTIGPRHWDLGWVLGEIAELSTSAPGPREHWRVLVDAVWRGYGVADALPDRAAIDRIATLRIALHLHDFIAYVGWSQSECRRYCGLLRVLIDGEVSP